MIVAIRRTRSHSFAINVRRMCVSVHTIVLPSLSLYRTLGDNQNETKSEICTRTHTHKYKLLPLKPIHTNLDLLFLLLHTLFSRLFIVFTIFVQFHYLWLYDFRLDADMFSLFSDFKFGFCLCNRKNIVPFNVRECWLFVFVLDIIDYRAMNASTMNEKKTHTPWKQTKSHVLQI